MDMAEGDVSLDAVDTPQWVNEPLEDDRYDGPHAHAHASDCFMCESGQDNRNVLVNRLHQVLGRHGEISDGSRFQYAGTVQHQIQGEATKTSAQCADELRTHELHHVMETTAINAENLKGLRNVARVVRGQLQRRNLETSVIEIDHKRLDTYMKVVKLQMEILKFKPEGLPFTKRRRVGAT
jgi:hypothetical protein